MNSLVLGGGGFLGSHLTERLVGLGHAVRIFEKEGFSRQNLAGVIDRIEVIEGDLGREDDAEAILKDIDVVFHLASTTLPASSNADPPHDIASNVLPTLRLLEVAKKARLKKLVFFSSGGTVYGIPKRIPIDEEHPTDPICSYGIHKLTIEKFLHLYHHLFHLNYCVLRISNAFGERQSPASGQGAIAAFLSSALRGDPIEVWGDGSAVRDYIYVSDIVEAAIAASQHRPGSGVFNIGSGTGTSLHQVIDVVSQAVGLPLEVRFSPPRAFDVPSNVLSIAKAKEELSWSPKVELAHGIRRMLRKRVGGDAAGDAGVP